MLWYRLFQYPTASVQGFEGEKLSYSVSAVGLRNVVPKNPNGIRVRYPICP